MPSSPRKAKSKSEHAAPPWERENPKSEKGEPHKTLSPAAKASAKRHAKAAGRPYPNLVDNMRAARGSKTTGAGKADKADKAKAT